MTVSKIASKIYQTAKAAGKGVWAWRLEWSKAMKEAWRKVMENRKHRIENIFCEEARSEMKEDGTVSIEIDTDAYNKRANGKPWIAIVSDDGYEWGQWSHSWNNGERGVLTITARPGDVIREGQKNTRSRHTYSTTYTVQQDGSLVEE